MKLVLGLALVAGVALAQQPNSQNATMTVIGSYGPPFPISANAPTNVPVAFSLSGLPGQTYAVYSAAALQPASATAYGGSVDLALTPFPTILVNGIGQGASTPYKLNASGQGGFAIFVPPSVPIGTQAAVQGLIRNPASPFGYTLTAATLITVTQGPPGTVLPFNDAGTSTVQVNLPFAVPFYGSNQTQATVSLDGYVAFTPGLTPTDPWLNPSVFEAGHPRCAIFWNDLVLAQGSVTSHMVTAPGPGLPPYWELHYTNVRSAASGLLYSFSFRIDANGEIRISFPFQLSPPSQLETPLTGITPGNSLSWVGMQNLSSFLFSPWIGATYHSIYEWFGYAGNPNWTGGPTNPFDLFGKEVHFLPNGPGALPASSSNYVVWVQ
jgi:hypothetical protein